ncbi:MAG: hypothetical protein M5U08_25960 [Burkholderiales bacterium]|nr:hypothetical protein [Burkholderiales bacterium]
MALSAVIRITYILGRFAVWGPADAVRYPARPKPRSPWSRALACRADLVAQVLTFREIVAV